ncbi:alpha-crystallin b chain [Plakobranchus ocellatus]|uniref:Alpha-crystallin b chain n=1 Tax=Plakobranchus ocellatus TaxID=259542 RepID=A0AAV3ZRN2_9GAST|nr:alpha-crystallin b chain [Plakobranchus ocellatus]
MATRIPITKDYNFDDRQKKVWEDMERDMERRRREPMSWWPQADRFVRFNMKDYSPEEVNVKMDSSKIMVSARHEEKSEGSSVSREYSREVNIPRDVDPLALQCTLNPDGYLVVHAPLPVPGYPAVKDGSGSLTTSKNPANTSTVVSSSSSFYNSPSGGMNKMSSSYQSSSSSTTSSSSKPQLQTHSSMPTYYQQRPQHSQQDQVKTQVISQQQTAPSAQHGSNNISANSSTKQPAASYATSRSESVREEMMNHPDHVVPSFKPPPDLSKLGFADSSTTSSSSHQMRSSPTPAALRQTHPQPPPSSSPSAAASHYQHNSSSAASTFHNPPNFPAPPSFGTSPLVPPPPFTAPPPFSSLSSTFPTGPLFPDSTAQVNQLSTPQITSHDGKFQLTMPIEDFKPEELTVKTQDGKVVICASRQVQDGNRSQSSEMSREHSLPANVDPLTVKAFFTDTGNLIVEAPFINA